MAAHPFRAASFCAGYGGLDLAVRLAIPGARTVLYVEREAYAAALLAQRMAEGALDEAPIWSDLGTFDGGRWRGAVDIVTAGLPCQPYSAAGKRRGHDDDRAIWPRFLDHVEAMQPALVFLENVPPFLQHFQPVGERLSGLGYRYSGGIFRAAEVGASHLRERLFILAYSDRQGFDWTRLSVSVGQSRQARGDASRCGATLAHAEGGSGALRPAESERLERSASASALDDALLGRYIEPQREVRAGRYATFPPGPADRAAWASILTERSELAPAVEPAVRGLVNGLAAAMDVRIDALRAAGNGVVPLTAALAFVRLAQECSVIQLTSHYEG